MVQSYLSYYFGYIWAELIMMVTELAWCYLYFTNQIVTMVNYYNKLAVASFIFVVLVRLRFFKFKTATTLFSNINCFQA